MSASRLTEVTFGRYGALHRPLCIIRNYAQFVSRTESGALGRWVGGLI